MQNLYDKLIEIFGERLEEPVLLRSNTDFLLNKLKETSSTELNNLYHKIIEVVNNDSTKLNKIEFNIIVNDPLIFKTSLLLCVLYKFVSCSPLFKGRHIGNEYPLPQWLIRIIIFGDEKFNFIKNYAFEHGFICF